MPIHASLFSGDQNEISDGRSLLQALDLIPDDLLMELLKEDRPSVWSEISPSATNNGTTTFPPEGSSKGLGVTPLVDSIVQEGNGLEFAAKSDTLVTPDNSEGCFSQILFHSLSTSSLPVNMSCISYSDYNGSSPPFETDLPSCTSRQLSRSLSEVSISKCSEIADELSASVECAMTKELVSETDIGSSANENGEINDNDEFKDDNHPFTFRSLQNASSEKMSLTGETKHLQHHIPSKRNRSISPSELGDSGPSSSVWTMESLDLDSTVLSSSLRHSPNYQPKLCSTGVLSDLTAALILPETQHRLEARGKLPARYDTWYQRSYSPRIDLDVEPPRSKAFCVQPDSVNLTSEAKRAIQNCDEQASTGQRPLRLRQAKRSHTFSAFGGHLGERLSTEFVSPKDEVTQELPSITDWLISQKDKYLGEPNNSTFLFNSFPSSVSSSIPSYSNSSSPVLSSSTLGTETSDVSFYTANGDFPPCFSRIQENTSVAISTAPSDHRMRQVRSNLRPEHQLPHFSRPQNTRFFGPTNPQPLQALNDTTLNDQQSQFPGQQLSKGDHQLCRIPPKTIGQLSSQFSDIASARPSSRRLVSSSSSSGVSSCSNLSPQALTTLSSVSRITSSTASSVGCLFSVATPSFPATSLPNGQQHLQSQAFPSSRLSFQMVAPILTRNRGCLNSTWNTPTVKSSGLSSLPISSLDRDSIVQQGQQQLPLSYFGLSSTVTANTAAVSSLCSTSGIGKRRRNASDSSPNSLISIMQTGRVSCAGNDVDGAGSRPSTLNSGTAFLTIKRRDQPVTAQLLNQEANQKVKNPDESSLGGIEFAMGTGIGCVTNGILCRKTDLDDDNVEQWDRQMDNINSKDPGFRRVVIYRSLTSPLTEYSDTATSLLAAAVTDSPLVSAKRVRSGFINDLFHIFALHW
ncbi:unnamed protein product [Protopolystoma xenopodis]|uniref:Uncharacterized protein n=1 Tax=Protopolystoma xenopodis TaxID=117903 RepID=A0A3S5CTC4_9PLAT|nr:unnamed protein product [Protopolystoma xenopodis]